MGGTQVTDYVGNAGEIFWDPTAGALRLSDGNTAGGSAISGGGASVGLASRNTTATVTKTISAVGGASDYDITGHKSYALQSLTTNKPCWVRLYVTDAARIADATRVQGVDPSPNAGVIAEAVVTGASGATVLFTPGVIGFNNDATPSTTIYARVVNNGSTNASISLSLDILKLEA